MDKVDKMEKIIEYLLEPRDSYPGLYGKLRYYFVRNDYDAMLDVIENRIDYYDGLAEYEGLADYE